MNNQQSWTKDQEWKQSILELFLILVNEIITFNNTKLCDVYRLSKVVVFEAGGGRGYGHAHPSPKKVSCIHLEKSAHSHLGTADKAMTYNIRSCFTSPEMPLDHAGERLLWYYFHDEIKHQTEQNFKISSSICLLLKNWLTCTGDHQLIFITSNQHLPIVWHALAHRSLLHNWTFLLLRTSLNRVQNVLSSLCRSIIVHETSLLPRDTVTHTERNMIMEDGLAWAQQTRFQIDQGTQVNSVAQLMVRNWVPPGSSTKENSCS